MKLVYHPEPLALLQARLPAALEEVYDYTEGRIPGTPGLKPVHVFDFESGVRLIVSRDRGAIEKGAEPADFLHVSGSCRSGSDVDHTYEKLARLAKTPALKDFVRNQWRAEIMTAFRSLDGRMKRRVLLKFMQEPPKYVVHFFFAWS